MSAYNGWTNWATWDTGLWIGNEAGLEDAAREVIVEARDRRPDRGVGFYDAAMALKAWWTGLHDPEEWGGAALPGPVLDAWNAHLDDVNWHELVAHYLEEAQ